MVEARKPATTPAQASNCVVKCVQKIDIDGHATYSYHIYGERIRKVLRELLRDYFAPAFHEGEPLDRDDLKLIYHVQGALVLKLVEAKTLPAEDADPEFAFQLEAVLEILEEVFAEEIVELKNIPYGEVSYNLLWTVFPPRTLIVSHDEFDQEVVLRVKSTRYTKTLAGDPVFEIRVDYIDMDGSHMGYVKEEKVQIEVFKSFRPVVELEHYPFQHYADKRAEFIARADKLMRLYGRHVQEYHGHALDEYDRKYNSQGRVVIDQATYQKLEPNSYAGPKISDRLEELTDEEKLTVNPVLIGFCLHSKTWGRFAISCLSDVEWDDTIIDSLVLPADQKQFIRVLVESHANSSFDDVVRDKGKGLVGLLAGPPGVGKTLTAEAIAEIAHRPLYTISSGELGASAETVQKGLRKILELGEAWNAVVLLDEADVFLVHRNRTDLLRNSITSIFLRELEYYRGILILTSNRHQDFDPAFGGRIHFFLEYPDLDVRARRAIWTTFLDTSCPAGQLDQTLTSDELDKLAELSLNGRQIKHVMKITHAVAAWNKAPITYQAVLTALKFLQPVVSNTLPCGLGDDGPYLVETGDR
ncbi:ATPase, AAA-type, core [Moelleriella libera RCEF 2490]|uniref:ATPase, AAA-type, core n=1 Tax=Moelleriella libera RCEF 2490 TaxID=1081109 RepID=A0A168BHA2_9HYPO|nr:ATPase, AAA-type, core [Moelleriella libera RCEF 2490]